MNGEEYTKEKIMRQILKQDYQIKYKITIKQKPTLCENLGIIQY